MSKLVSQIEKAMDIRRNLGNRTKTVLDSIQAGIFIIEAETHQIIYANPEAGTGTTDQRSKRK
jgi:PAS domain-containing protein